VTKHLHTLGLVFVFALASSAVARTQDAPPQPVPPPPAPAASTVTPLRIQVVISRYQGEKKVSSLPYSLSVNATDTPRNPGRANLRMGAKVPVVMFATPVVDGQKMPSGGPLQYQDVGTNIDCSAVVTESGRFRLDITVDDSSVYPEDQNVAGASPATKGSPTFRSFRASDSMVLKDGGTAQFTTATDKVSGEIVKVDVTLTVVK